MGKIVRNLFDTAFDPETVKAYAMPMTVRVRPSTTAGNPIS